MKVFWSHLDGAEASRYLKTNHSGIEVVNSHSTQRTSEITLLFL